MKNRFRADWAERKLALGVFVIFYSISFRFDLGMRRTKHIRTVQDASLTALMVMMTLSASIHAIPSGQKYALVILRTKQLEALSSRKFFHFITNGNNLKFKLPHLICIFVCAFFGSIFRISPLAISFTVKHFSHVVSFSYLKNMIANKLAQIVKLNVGRGMHRCFWLLRLLIGLLVSKRKSRQCTGE